jgi:hypothetical protein
VPKTAQIHERSPLGLTALGRVFVQLSLRDILETSSAEKDELLYNGTHTAKWYTSHLGVTGLEGVHLGIHTLLAALFLGPLDRGTEPS